MSRKKTRREIRLEHERDQWEKLAFERIDRVEELKAELEQRDAELAELRARARSGGLAGGRPGRVLPIRKAG